MKHSYIKSIVHALFICFALTSNSSHVQATTTSNYIEMGLALAAIPVDITAQHYALTHGKQAAAPLNLATDIINLLNKFFFFYNNMQAQTADGKWHFQRDCLVNGAIAIRDITKIVQHIKESTPDTNDPLLPNNILELDDAQLSDFLAKLNADQLNNKPLNDDQPNGEQQGKIIHDYSKAGYTWHVAALPMLKGLSAFLLAWAQDESHSFFGEHARFVATAIHSLTRLLDEYTALEADSPYRKVILGLLIVNAVWLIVETKGYYDHLPRRWNRGPVNHEGECTICTNTNADFEQDGKHNHFRELRCGHVFCKDCLTQHINTQLKDNNFANLHCPSKNCQHLIDIEEIRNTVDNDMKLLSNYEDAAFQDWAIKAQQSGLRQCPTPNCGYRFINDQNHRGTIVCQACHRSYCGNCLVNHPNGTPCQLNAASAGGEDNARWLNENARRCQCGNMIERNGGCNHMTCRQCRYEFCWICGKKWGLAGCRSFSHD